MPPHILKIYLICDLYLRSITHCVVCVCVCVSVCLCVCVCVCMCLYAFIRGRKKDRKREKKRTTKSLDCLALFFRLMGVLSLYKHVLPYLLSFPPHTHTDKLRNPNTLKTHIH